MGTEIGSGCRDQGTRTGSLSGAAAEWRVFSPRGIQNEGGNLIW